MTISTSELDMMRAAVTAVLPDECTISRPSDGGTLDPDTGIWTPDPATVVYTGPCLIRPADNAEVQRLFGDTQVTKQRFVAKLPHDVAAVAIDDLFVVTSSSDPHLTSRRFHVAAIGGGSYHVERKLGLVEEVPE